MNLPIRVLSKRLMIIEDESNGFGGISKVILDIRSVKSFFQLGHSRLYRYSMTYLKYSRACYYCKSMIKVNSIPYIPKNKVIINDNTSML